MVIAALIFLSVITAVWVFLLLNPAHARSFGHRLDPGMDVPGAAESLPSLTIVVPARNEASMLPQTIPSFCRQEYPDLTVVLIDDHSDDGSDRVIAALKEQHPNLIAINSAPRPPGWMGKCWAVKQGVDVATTDFLLFTDADVLFHPQAARLAMQVLLAGRLDMLSLFPRPVFGQAIEAIGMAGLVSVLSMLFPVGWANDPNRKTVALAAGGFILLRRNPYERVGGHEALKSHMIEDVNLAKRLKADGASVHCRFTQDLATTRMYEGFSDMWEGLSKNAYAGMEFRPERFWVGLIIGMLVNVLPPVYLAGSVIWVCGKPSTLAWTCLLLCIVMNLCIVAIHARTIRFLRLPWYHALLMPVSAALYVVISVNSAWQHHFRGGNVWKGRRYERDVLISAHDGSGQESSMQ